MEDKEIGAKYSAGITRILFSEVFKQPLKPNILLTNK
jgi:hypothetical protein